MGIMDIASSALGTAQEQINKGQERRAQAVQARAGGQYVVLQIVLREEFIGSGSKNLTELEDVINAQAELGYRLHTISTSTGNSTGVLGGDRIQATLVFEKID